MSAAAAPARATKPKTRPEGYSKLPHWFVEHLPRITYGESEIWIVLWVWRMTEGKERQPGSEAPFWSDPITAAEMARMFHRTVTAIEGALKDLCWDEGEEKPGRGVLLRKK